MVAALLLAAAAVAPFVARPWRHAVELPVVLLALLAAALASLPVAAAVDVVATSAGHAWTTPWTGRPATLGYLDGRHLQVLVLLPLTAALMLAALTWRRAPQRVPAAARDLAAPMVAGLLAASAVVLLDTGRPLVTTLASVVVASALLGWWAAPRTDRAGAAGLVGSAGWGSVAVLVALPSVGLTAVTLALLVATSAWLLERAQPSGHDAAVRATCAVVLPAALAGLGWTLGELAGRPGRVARRADARGPGPGGAGPTPPGASRSPRACPAPPSPPPRWSPPTTCRSRWRRTSPSPAPWSSAWPWPTTTGGTSAGWAALSSPPPPGSGCGTSASTSPRPTRCPPRWPSCWSGWRHLARHPGAGTGTALTPGLLLATVPSLLVVLGEDPVSLRAALLGLALPGPRAGRRPAALAGARWSSGRRSAPCSCCGWPAPYAAAVPSWMLIAVAGAALLVVGVTWEARLRDLRGSADYLARLR